jgi:hypothetical protein
MFQSCFLIRYWNVLDVICDACEESGCDTNSVSELDSGLLLLLLRQSLGFALCVCD